MSTPHIYDDTGPLPPSHPPPPAPGGVGGVVAGVVPAPQIDRRLKPGRGADGGTLTGTKKNFASDPLKIYFLC